MSACENCKKDKTDPEVLSWQLLFFAAVVDNMKNFDVPMNESEIAGLVTLMREAARRADP